MEFADKMEGEEAAGVSRQLFPCVRIPVFSWPDTMSTCRDTSVSSCSRPTQSFSPYAAQVPGTEETAYAKERDWQSFPSATIDHFGGLRPAFRPRRSASLPSVTDTASCHCCTTSSFYHLSVTTNSIIIVWCVRVCVRMCFSRQCLLESST